jgi:sporulation protein YlmC with PRC-barrel domain
MWKPVLAAMLAFALSAVPAVARTAPDAPIAKGEAQLYGLPIFTSDGVQIGVVAETGTDDNGYTVLLAKIEKPISRGTQIVAIPLELVVLRGERIDLFLTATEVRERLSSVEADGDQRSAH